MCFCFVSFIFWDGNKENCRDEDCWAGLGQTLFCTFKYLSWIFYKNISLNIESYFKSEQKIFGKILPSPCFPREKLAVFVFFIKWWRYSIILALSRLFTSVFSVKFSPQFFVFFLTGQQFSDLLRHYHVSQLAQRQPVYSQYISRLYNKVIISYQWCSYKIHGICEYWFFYHI